VSRGPGLRRYQSVKEHSHETGTKTTGLGSVILHRPSVIVQSHETNSKLSGAGFGQAIVKGTVS
jgi:hypothetical protein